MLILSIKKKSNQSQKLYRHASQQSYGYIRTCTVDTSQAIKVKSQIRHEFMAILRSQKLAFKLAII